MSELYEFQLTAGLDSPVLLRADLRLLTQSLITARKKKTLPEKSLLKAIAYT